MFAASLDLLTYLDRIVPVDDQCRNQTRNNVDEKADERVQVDLREDPNVDRFSFQIGECGIHVIAVDQAEECFERGRQGAVFAMVGSEHDPSTEHESTIDDQSAEEKTKNERKGSLDGDEEKLNTPV